MSANVVIERNENGLISGLKINGKPAMKSYVNALVKAQTLPYWIEFHEPRTVYGACGGVFNLTGLEASIFVFARNWEMRYNRAGNPKDAGAPIQTFDNMRYLFLAINPDAWEDLLH